MAVHSTALASKLKLTVINCFLSQVESNFQDSMIHSGTQVPSLLLRNLLPSSGTSTLLRRNLLQSSGTFYPPQEPSPFSMNLLQSPGTFSLPQDLLGANLHDLVPPSLDHARVAAAPGLLILSSGVLFLKFLDFSKVPALLICVLSPAGRRRPKVPTAEKAKVGDQP